MLLIMQKPLNQSKLFTFLSKKGTFFYLKDGEKLMDSSICGKVFETLTLPEDFDLSRLEPAFIKATSSAILLKSPNLNL